MDEISSGTRTTQKNIMQREQETTTCRNAMMKEQMLNEHSMPEGAKIAAPQMLSNNVLKDLFFRGNEIRIQ